MAQKRKRVDFAEENAPSTSKQCISGDNQSLQEPSATKQTSINFAFEILKLYQTKQYESALSLIDQLKKLPPTHPQYRKEDARTEFKIIEATILAETKREAEAETILKRILEKDPNNSFALYAKGVMLYNNGDFRGSVKPLDRAIALNATSMRRAMDYRAKAGMLIDLVNEGKSAFHSLSLFDFYLFFFLTANEHFRNNRFTVMVETLRMASQVDPANKKLQETIDQIRNFLIGQVMGRLESEALGKQPEHYSTAEKLIAGYKLKEASSLIKEIAKEVPRTAKAAFLVGFYNYMVSFWLLILQYLFLYSVKSSSFSEVKFTTLANIL